MAKSATGRDVIDHQQRHRVIALLLFTAHCHDDISSNVEKEMVPNRLMSLNTSLLQFFFPPKSMNTGMEILVLILWWFYFTCCRQSVSKYSVMIIIIMTLIFILVTHTHTPSLLSWTYIIWYILWKGCVLKGRIHYWPFSFFRLDQKMSAPHQLLPYLVEQTWNLSQVAKYCVSGVDMVMEWLPLRLLWLQGHLWC